MVATHRELALGSRHGLVRSHFAGTQYKPERGKCGSGPDDVTESLGGLGVASAISAVSLEPQSPPRNAAEHAEETDLECISWIEEIAPIEKKRASGYALRSKFDSRSRWWGCGPFFRGG